MTLSLFLIVLLLLVALAWCIREFLRFSSSVYSAVLSNRHELRQEDAATGGMFSTWPLGRAKKHFVIGADPQLIAEVFGARQFAHFGARKGPLPPPGTGHVFIAYGQRWKELRKRVSFFSKQNLDLLDPLLLVSLDQMLEAMAAENGQIADFQKHNVRLTSSIIARIAFCAAFPERELEEFPMEYAAYAERLAHARRVERETETKHADAQRKGTVTQGFCSRLFWNYVLGNVPKKRRTDFFADVYAHILQVDCKKQGIMSQEDHDLHGDERIESKLGKIFLDGSMKVVGLETVGHCLAVAIHMLSEHPVVQRRLQLELGLHSEESPLLMAIIRETLRLYPIVSFACSRVCSSTTVLKANSGHFDVGDSVELDVFALGRDKIIWGDDADQFRPERWLDEGALPANWRQFWLPFGVGPRACAGIPLAIRLLKLAISAIFRRFRITSPGGGGGGHKIHLIGSDVLYLQRVPIQVEEVPSADEF